jgi:cytochrome b
MRAPRYLGHSPAGAMMVFALLFTLAGTVVTGMAQLALSRGEGPFSLFLEQQATPAQPSDAVTAGAPDRDEGRREEESLTKEAHELFANLTLILIGFHIAGIVIASVAHKESLVLAMITGLKRASPPQGGP